MANEQPLDSVPLWILYILTVLVLLAMVEAGFRFSSYLKRKKVYKEDISLGGTVGASLALLAFLLAFVVGYGTNIMNERRHLVVDEANAIGTTYLRAGYLDEPYSSTAQELLREYTDLRVEATEIEDAPQLIERSTEIQNELWADAEAIARADSTPTTSLYISTLNEMIDLQAERIAVGLDIRIPPAVLLGLYIVAMFSLFLVGIQSGYSEKRNYMAQIVLVLILSLVFMLLADLDRADEGLLKVSEQPQLDLQKQLNQ